MFGVFLSGNDLVSCCLLLTIQYAYQHSVKSLLTTNLLVPTQFVNKRKKMHKVVGMFKSKGEGKQLLLVTNFFLIKVIA